MRYVSASDDDYYKVRWDLELPAEIIGKTVVDAHQKLLEILGPPSPYRRWCIRVEKIVQELGGEVNSGDEDQQKGATNDKS